MAIAFGRALGTAVLNTSGTTLVITTSATATVGEWIIVRVAADNLSATTPTFTCADSASNTYTVDRQDARVATAAAGIAGAVISAPVTTQLTSGGTITITLSGAVFAKAAVAEAYTGVGGRRASGTNSGGGANTTPTITLTTPVSGDLVIGHVARESRTDPSAYDTDTTDGSWTTGATLNSAAGGTDNQRVQVIYQHKIVTGTGSQTYNVTVTSSVDWLAFESAYEPSGAADQTLDGSLFTVTPTFTAGRVDFQIPGALFTRPPTFLTGVVVADQTLAGALFTRAPVFDAGAVTTTDQNGYRRSVLPGADVRDGLGQPHARRCHIHPLPGVPNWRGHVEPHRSRCPVLPVSNLPRRRGTAPSGHCLGGPVLEVSNVRDGTGRPSDNRRSVHPDTRYSEPAKYG